MKNLIQAAVVTLFAASTAQAQQAVQWKVSDGGNGHWYGMRPIDYSRSWSDFIGTCAQIGATPAVLNSSSDADWISSHVVTNPPGDGALLGAELIPTSAGGVEWRWIDGSSLSSSVPWCGGAPSGPAELERWLYMNDQAHAHPTAPAGCLDDCPWGGWSSINVPWAVVEWSADCNNDGIVDYGQCQDGTLPDYDGNNIPDCCERGEACVVGNYPVQWKVSEGGNGHWYQARQCDCCFAQAAAIATSIGGQLASIDEAGEQSRVVTVVPTTRAAKLGGFREPAADQYLGWQWLSGRPFNPAFISWADGNPGCCGAEQYWLFLQATPGGGFGLHDGFNCAWPGSDFMLIEWSADCTADGIVDYGQILQGQLSDTNTDGVPDICQQPTCVDADIFRDFNVNGADLGILLSQWGPNTPLTRSDLNRDGVVDGSDLGIFLSFWGPCP
jgi:hypothetical protein